MRGHDYWSVPVVLGELQDMIPTIQNDGSEMRGHDYWSVPVSPWSSDYWSVPVVPDYWSVPVVLIIGLSP